jgi:hypothetical protein
VLSFCRGDCMSALPRTVGTIKSILPIEYPDRQHDRCFPSSAPYRRGIIGKRDRTLDPMIPARFDCSDRHPETGNLVAERLNA